MKSDDGRDIKFIPIPKPVSKKLRETKLSKRERDLVDIILEQTLGYEAFKRDGESYRRTSKALSSRYLSILSGMPRSTVNYELERLEKRNIAVTTEGWFNGQRTKHVGINLDVGQWDKSNGRISQKEYIQLHKQAKQLVKEWFEDVFSAATQPRCKVEQGRSRDKRDLVLYNLDGTHFLDISVIVKVSWGDTINWDHLVIPEKVDTIFCTVNKPMTMMAIIQPHNIKDLTPRDGHYRVPRELDAQGEDRIRIKSLACSTNLGAASKPSGGNLND
jgi:hypothetical protein